MDFERQVDDATTLNDPSKKYLYVIEAKQVTQVEDHQMVNYMRNTSRNKTAAIDNVPPEWMTRQIPTKTEVLDEEKEYLFTGWLYAIQKAEHLYYVGTTSTPRKRLKAHTRGSSSTFFNYCELIHLKEFRPCQRYLDEVNTTSSLMDFEIDNGAVDWASFDTFAYSA